MEDCPQQHSYGTSEQKLAGGEEEVRFSEKTGSFAPLSIRQKSQSLPPGGELLGYTELIMMANIF